MAATTRMTLEEFLALPPTKPTLEYIDGEVVEKTMGTKGHGWVQSLLVLAFALYLRTHPIGLAFPEWRCVLGPAGEEESRVPDFAFITNDHAGNDPLDAPHFGPPDLAVEILSPDDRPGAVLDKVTYYLTNGVRLVWVIDPIRRRVTVFAPDTTPRSLTDADTLDGGDVLPDFAVAVAEILPQLPGAAANPPA